MFEQMKMRSFFGGLMLFFVLFFLGIAVFGKPSYDVMQVIIMYWFIVLFPLVWFGWQVFRQKHSLFVPLTAPTKATIGETLFLFIVLLFFSIGFLWVSDYVVSLFAPHYLEASWKEDMPMPENHLLLVLLLLNASFFSPIAEELIFRGLLFKRIGAKLSPLWGAIISSLLFSFLHADIIGSFVFGFVLCLFYLKTGNLLLTIILHILNNSLVTIVPTVPAFMDYDTISEMHASTIPSLLCFVLSGILLSLYVKKHWSIFQKTSV